MRIINFSGKVIFVVAFFLIVGSCEKEEEDPCLKTKWLQAKEYEIKLAVHVSESNPQLPGGTPGSLSPVDFQKMLVNGTIEKIECSGLTTGPVNLGNSYITKGIDYPAPIDIPKSYWIGHVVYVYDFDNDEDHLNINLTVKITMPDGQSYMCNISNEIYGDQIERVPGELHYYVLLDVNSNTWVKV